MAWHRTGVAFETMPVGTTREVLLGATSVLLVRTEGGLYAVEALCPHLGGLLADGTLVGRRLTCPEHAAVFDVADGNVLADPYGVEPPQGAVDSLRTFGVRLVAGAIEVELPSD
jgi:nitrite reductase/ring-hydroxylating ferredoxin subunit